MSRKRVLVADDNEHNRDLARQILIAGYDVAVAANGAEALAMAQDEKLDLILLDLSMPRMNGWDVARALKADEATAKVPLVACTAHAMTGDRERALAVGFDGYLAKPYRPRELVAVVADFLGPGQAPSHDPHDEDEEWSLREDDS
jgi:CheY-like chemotaxis protein